MKSFITAIVVINSLDLVCGIYNRFHHVVISDTATFLAACMELGFTLWGAVLLGREVKTPEQSTT